MDHSDLLGIARRVADAGALKALQLFDAGVVRTWHKADRSCVTEADLASEAAILSTLDELAPGQAVISEESGGDARGSARWIVDPIDGTENYSRRHPVWATLVAREVDGEVVVAVAVAPALGQRWWARRGHGAFTEGRNGVQRLAVSVCRDRELATFDCGGLHDCPTPRHREAVLATAARFRCAWGWGNFWGHIQVAEGAAEAALSYGARIWDVAVPALLVSEAGGRWTDTEGVQSLNNGTLLTSNGNFHGELVRELSGLVGPEEQR